MTIDAAPRESVLVPIDGSDGSLAAVAEVVRRACISPPPLVHLLNVQPQVPTEILAHLPPAAGEDYYGRAGGDALLRARSMLDAAGVPYEAQRLVGPVVETILEQCEALQCDAIVMGTHGRGGLLGALLGSTATGVVHRSRVPVTLVRAPGQLQAGPGG